jgi:1,4-alpha-glucan branching enzyme
MQALDREFRLLDDPFIELLHAQEEQKVLVFRRGPLVWVFNFHAEESYPDYRIGVPDPADYRLVLATDDAAFGGFGRVTTGQTYPRQQEPAHGRAQSIQLYLPARSAQVIRPM